MFEQQIASARVRILNMVREHDLESEVLVAALSDVLAYTALMLDQQCGVQPIEGRLQAVVRRAHHTYGRARGRLV